MENNQPSQPEQSQPEQSQPEQSQPEQSQPEQSQPEPSQPKTSQHSSSSHTSSQPEQTPEKQPKPPVVDSKNANWLRSRRHTLYSSNEVQEFTEEMEKLKTSVTHYRGWPATSLLWVIPAAIGLTFLGFLLTGFFFLAGDSLMSFVEN